MGDGTPTPIGAATPVIPADRLTRFTGRGADYARHRPSYPTEAIDAILAGLGEPSSLRVADVGAGTGISARLLADRGCHVTAIEPNADMRLAAGSHERIVWSEGTGERTGLADASVAVVLCAQSFHWMEPAPTLAEFARVLAPGGRIALMWNAADEATPIGSAYRELILRHATKEVTSPGKTGAHDRALGQLRAAPGFGRERHLTFDFHQRMTFDQFVGRVKSCSYCPTSGYAFEVMSGDLAALFDAHADGAGAARAITLPYTTHLFLAEREAS